MKRFLTLVLTIILCYNLNGQVTKETYEKADTSNTFNNLVYHSPRNFHWINDSKLWYKKRTEKGEEYILVDVKKANKQNAFDQVKFAEKWNKITDQAIKPYALPLHYLKFASDLKSVVFQAFDYYWSCELPSYKITKGKPVEKENRRDWYESDDDSEFKIVESPDKTKEAYIKNYNVYIKDKESEKETVLSFDGSEGDYFSNNINWSPDSKKLAVMKVRANKEHIIYRVESSPKDQLQPKLQDQKYLKPGDAVALYRPTLFDITNFKQVELNTQPYDDQYYVSRIQWREDSRAFTFEYNQRGHQVYQVLEVDANSGDIKTLIDERFETFVHYGKRYRYDVSDGAEIIWASERDGWNHLYLFDGETGKIKNQITKGEWVVRGIEHVDEENRTIIFRASGQNPDEDPYYIHYYKINFDGTGMMELTPEKEFHSASFSNDKKYFVDRYSKINKPQTTVLRNAANGSIVMVLEEADITKLLERNYKMPEVFVAKGRDGKTDIWGNVYFPTSFDSTKIYPILEYIYAGPHSSHVRKTFAPYMYWVSELIELGFVVVSIDGMGTSNRSKEFHDVCWRNLKDAGFPDRIPWIKALAEKHTYLDTSRVGIYGASAGGQNAMGALLFYPEFYKVGFALNGCHDNRMDKIWWNEQWMGYPIGPWYEDNSNVTHAHKLQGKLLLITGELDSNVDPASGAQVVNALVEANKDFEMVIVPNMGHYARGKFVIRRYRDFFVKHLLNQEVPDWNK